MIELIVSDGEEIFVLSVKPGADGGVVGHIQTVASDQRVDAFAQTQHNPETRYATAGECLLALMRALFPALGVRE